jgi:hypothetical protein
MANTVAARIAEDIAKPQQVAEVLGISLNSLTQMRYRGTGPPFTRVGYRVRYR